MKKIIFLILLLSLLTGCVNSVPINSDRFVESINNQFNFELISEASSITKTEKDKIITYYFTNDYDITIATYTDIKSGIIEKYTVTGNANDKQIETFNNIFYNTVSKNNSHIFTDTLTAGELKIYTYEDLRYKNKNTNPTIKK